MNDNSSLTDLLVIDIETVPGVSHFQELPESWRSLWLGKISKTVPENISPEEFYDDKAGIFAEFGRVVCISAGFFYTEKDGEIFFKIKSLSNSSEVELLRSFFNLVEKFKEKRPQFCYAGHNIKEFDIPFICRRTYANQLPLPAFLQFNGMKPWEVNLVDTMQLWKFGDHKNYTSLKLLAAVLNVPTPKDDIDGSMVKTVYYEEKNLPRIVEYCQKDVIAVANVLLRLRNLPILNPQNIFVAE